MSNTWKLTLQLTVQYSAVFETNKLPFHCTKYVLLMRNTLIYYFNSMDLISPNAEEKSACIPPIDTTLKLVHHTRARVIKFSYDLVNLLNCDFGNKRSFSCCS
jgi:hypothetical protein